MRKSKWYPITLCTKCEQRIYSDDVAGRMGICPNCGHDSDSTVCDVTNVIVREIKHYKWYALTNRKKSWEGANPFSIKWLEGLMKRVK